MKALLSFALLGVAFTKSDSDSAFLHHNFRAEKEHHSKHDHRGSHKHQKPIHADDEFMFLGKNGDFPRRNQQMMEHFRKTNQAPRHVAHDDFEGDEFFNLLRPFHHSKNKHHDSTPQVPQTSQKSEIQSLVKSEGEELYIEDDFLCCRRGDGNPLHASVSCIRFQELDDDDFALLSRLIKESKDQK